MKILDYDDFYYIAQQTDKIFGLIHSWRFLDLECKHPTIPYCGGC